MKRNHRLLLIVFAILTCFTLAFSVGCGNTKNVSVTFETNGGEEIETATIKSGAEYTLPTPEKDGYVFVGWYLSADLSGEKVDVLNSSMTKENVTVYAKWEKPQATITLDTNGGTLKDTTVSAAIDSNIYDSVKNIAPIKTDHMFAYWSVDGKTEIARNKKVPKEGITLKAVYKVKYTVEVNVQSIDEKTGVTGDYVPEKELHVGYAFVGNEVDVSDEVLRNGFSLANNSSTVSKLTISETPAENSFRLFFDRDEIIVRFFSNYPDSSLKEEVKTKKIIFGTRISVITEGFDCAGYLLSGWSDGDNEYKAYAFNDNLYDPATGTIGGGKQENDSFVPQDNVDLDAVWMKGISDLFGGKDYVYLYDNKSEPEVYVQKGKIFFKAEYSEVQIGDAIVRGFTFGEDEGRIYDENKFYAYANSSRKKYSAFKYDIDKDGNGYLNESVKISFDEYNGVTYRVYDEDNKNVFESSGVYDINESGFYHATFNDEYKDFNGKELVFSIGTFGKSNAFRPRDEFEFGLDKIYYYGLSGGALQKYTTYLKLTGFGVGALFTASGNSYVYYSRLNDVLSLKDSSGQSMGTYKIIADPNGGKDKGFVSYNANIDTVFETTDKKTSLTLDGMYKATYVTDGKSYVGNYSVLGSSVFGGSLIRLYTQSGNITLSLGARNTTKIEFVDGKLTEVQVTKYIFDEKGENYAEYYYFTPDSKAQQWPLLVFDETPELSGKVSIYGKVTKDSKSTYSEVPVIIGTYTYDEPTKLYTVNVESYNDIEGLDSDLFVYSELRSFTFATAAISNKPVYYVYSVQNKGDTEETSKLVVYENTDKTAGGTVTIVNGSIAIVDYQGKLLKSTFSTDASTGITTISGSTTYYVQLSDVDGKKTFKFVDAPFGALYMEHYGSVDQNEYIVFDGLGGAVYHYATTVDGVTTKKSFNGAYVVTDEKVKVGSAEYSVYMFTTDNYMNVEGSEKSFKFIRVVVSKYYCAVVYKDNEKGEYVDEDTDATLVLDGYLYATYSDEKGLNYTGLYTVSNGVIVMITNNGYFYFTFPTETEKFSVKGTEYGTYTVIDNQSTNGYYVELIGNKAKTAKVFKWKTDEQGKYVVENDSYVREYVDENASYTINGSDVEVSYKNGGKFSGKLGVVSSNNRSIPVLCLYSDTVERTYVNPKDMSVMVLDTVGNVTRYGKQGLVKTGSYLLISDRLFFYISSDMSAEGAGVYVYDKVACTAVLQKVKDIPSGGYVYYTENFESLTFTAYGLASSSVDGAYYYEVTTDGKIVLYKYDEKSADKNEYGFVRNDSLGSFGATLKLNDKNYIEYDGSVLEVTRSDEGKYPFRYVEGSEELYDIVNVSFTPTGELGFDVTGTATIKKRSDNKTQDVACRIVRKVEGEVVVSTTLIIGTYNFDISLSYGIENEHGVSKMSVNSEKMLKEGYSNSYLTNLFYYSFFSPAQAAEFTEKYKDKMGKMTVCENYDENGALIDSYASASFADGTRYVDTSGKNLSFDSSAYTYKNGIYSVDISTGDGIDYRMSFTFGTNRYVGEYAFTMIAFARVETFDLGDGMVVTAQRNICSDSLSPGALYSLTIVEDGKEVETIGYYSPDENNSNVLTYISRGVEEGGNKISTYYTFELSDALSSKVIEPIDYDGKRVLDSDKKEVSVYAYNIALKGKEPCDVYESVKGDRYVEITKNHEVKLYGFYATATQSAIYYFPSQSSYDEATGVYKIEVKVGQDVVSLYFKINNGRFEETSAPSQE